MNTTGLEELYTEIASSINEMIPEDWDKIIAYAEIREGYKKVFFYYFPQNDGKPIYSLDIPDLFEFDEDEFEDLDNRLGSHFENLHSEFIKNNQDVWTNLTFKLESSGEFKIDFGYEDLSGISPVEKQIIWEYKYLGIMPEDKDDRKIIDNYINIQNGKES